MYSNQKTGRITGVMLLFVFVSGVTIFQFLQASVLSSDSFITAAAANSNKLITSVVLFIFSGIIDIIIAAILLPIFKRHSPFLAYLYFAFCILNFLAIMIDNISVLSMLEFSQDVIKNGYVNSDSLMIMESLLSQRHWWTHYLFLLLSCFPVFVMYYTFYVSKLVPRIIAIFGIVAVILMFTEELFSIFGNSISMNMMLPMGLIQLLLPIWLIVKGFNNHKLETSI